MKTLPLLSEIPDGATIKIPGLPIIPPFAQHWIAYFADSLIDKYQNYIKGDDGLLYFSFGDRGGNIFYKSSEFSLISETADEIRFQLIGHYDEAGPGGSASNSPYTETCEVKLVNTENGWRFAGFAMAY